LSDIAEIDPARRNLMVLTSVLLVIELAGATIKAINAPAVTIEIQRPELIVWFLYIILIYLIFRFWQIARTTHIKYSQISNKFINQSSIIKTISDITLNKDEGEGYYVDDNNPLITRGFFKRTLTISGHNKHGRGVQKGPIKLPYIKLLLPELIADFRAIPNHKDFVEYTLPFLYASAVLALKAFLLFHYFVIW
jgi:hypothetical protein